ncbi:uncharacterized protein G2W53_034123 [Senna tora]|uniref:Uncharacterized protein n=1 Tax=Senna tora TaxID=362788 RepID=A0A834T1E7_9FABA|nr:uncharacterized protein G2W53_034123 [Senna tora]
MASSPIPSTSSNREPFIPNRSNIFSGHHPFKLLQAVMKADEAIGDEGCMVWGSGGNWG